MVNLVGLARSLDSSGAQSAATPASISRPLPPGKASAEPTDASLSTSDVRISAEGVRQLQLAAQREEEQVATLGAVRKDAALASRMVHEMAYRREIIIALPATYSDLPTSLYLNGTSPASNAASIQRVHSRLEQARMTRIAIYESEMAKGTPPAEIYNRLSALMGAGPTGYLIVAV